MLKTRHTDSVNVIDAEKLQKSLDYTPTDPNIGHYLSALLCRFRLYSDGFWPRTGQWSVGVQFNRHDVNSNMCQVSGLLYLMPYVKAIPTVRFDVDKCIIGAKPFTIKHCGDSTVSYNFFVREDNSVVLNYIANGISEYEEIGDFNTAMKYIQKNHYAYPNDQKFDFDGHNCYY